MNSIGKLRGAYFAMTKRIEWDRDQRVDFHASLGLPESSTDFTREQWEVAVARLQQLTGRANVRYATPQLKRERRAPGAERIPDGLDVTASPKQLAWIRDLAGQITWTHADGPEAGLRGLILATWPKAGDESEKQQWERHSGRVELLDRAHANTVIVVLRRMAAREAAAVAAGD